MASSFLLQDESDEILKLRQTTGVEPQSVVSEQLKTTYTPRVPPERLRLDGRLFETKGAVKLHDLRMLTSGVTLTGRCWTGREFSPFELTLDLEGGRLVHRQKATGENRFIYRLHISYDRHNMDISLRDTQRWFWDEHFFGSDGVTLSLSSQGGYSASIKLHD